VPFDFNTTKQELAGLDERLRPIARRIVDVNDPDWANKLRQAPNPLDQAGIRLEAEAMLGSLLQPYRTEGPGVRASIRKLLASNPSFTWAANVQQNPTTEEGFRLQLLFLSAMDQAADLRDTISTLNDICAKAKAAGVETRPILKEVAALSSDEKSGAMGSVRSILLNAR
jgi:hypothetical protein